MISMARVEIYLDIKPFGVNKAYRHNPEKGSKGGIVRRFKTSEYRAFKKEMLLKLNLIRDKVVLPKPPYKVLFIWGMKNDAMSDWDGPIKTAQDVLFEWLDVNDNKIYDGRAIKIHCQQEYIRIFIDHYDQRDKIVF